MAKFLITGGAGFIGSHLADELILLNHEVVILDNFSTGKLENIPSAAKAIEGDIADKNLICSLFDDIDGCFHLAAIASVERCIEEWSDSHLVNAVGVVNIFEAASKQKRKVPVIYASSAAIYGDNVNVPLIESEPPLPQTPYGIDKYSCELYGHVADIVHNVPNIGYRFFNVYGSRQNPKSPYSGVISIFADLIGAGKDIQIFGDGTQTRDFVHVSDAVRTMSAGMEQIIRMKQGHQIFNVCTGNATSVNDLADLICDITGNEVCKNYVHQHPIYIKELVGSPLKLKNMLGITTETELRQGLEETLASIVV